jgi:hypothetical protein
MCQAARAHDATTGMSASGSTRVPCMAARRFTIRDNSRPLVSPSQRRAFQRLHFSVRLDAAGRLCFADPHSTGVQVRSVGPSARSFARSERPAHRQQSRRRRRPRPARRRRIRRSRISRLETRQGRRRQSQQVGHPWPMHRGCLSRAVVLGEPEVLAVVHRRAAVGLVFLVDCKITNR